VREWCTSKSYRLDIFASLSICYIALEWRSLSLTCCSLVRPRSLEDNLLTLEQLKHIAGVCRTHLGWQDGKTFAFKPIPNITGDVVTRWDESIQQPVQDHTRKRSAQGSITTARTVLSPWHIFPKHPFASWIFQQNFASWSTSISYSDTALHHLFHYPRRPITSCLPPCNQPSHLHRVSTGPSFKLKRSALLSPSLLHCLQGQPPSFPLSLKTDLLHRERRTTARLADARPSNHCHGVLCVREQIILPHPLQ
jgi:hypothetical protein